MSDDDSGPLRGVRDKCSLEIGDVPDAADQADLRSKLRAGDIVLFKTSDNWLSRVITTLDGYWTHAGIIVDTEADDGPHVVHAVVPRPIQQPLSVVAQAKNDGFAVGRPTACVDNPDLGIEAAEWALRFADPANENTVYGGSELGEACALLLRGNIAAVRLEADGYKEAATDEWDVVDDYPEFEGTCSGLVYQCYERAGHKLAFEPAPGLWRDEESDTIRTRDRSDFVVPGDRELVRAESLQRFSTMAFYARLLGKAAPAFLSGITRTELAVASGISPADLWTTTDPATRLFGSAEYGRMARDFVSDCP
jgi:hypothetical protein